MNSVLATTRHLKVLLEQLIFATKSTIVSSTMLPKYCWIYTVFLVTKTLTVFSTPLSNELAEEYGNVRFPTSEEEVTIKQVPRCAGKTYCDNLGSYVYPKEQLERTLRKNAYWYHLFGTPKNQDDPTERMGPGENFVCTSLRKIIYPQTAENANKEWKWTFNTGKYVQGVQVEVCHRPEEPCGEVFKDLPLDVRTFCRQKYIYRALLAADSRGNPTVDYFKLPSACACAYSSNYGFLGGLWRT